MPHCVIEYSENLSEKLDIKKLMIGLNEVMSNSNLFDLDSIKIRALSYKDFLLSNKYASFIHITIKILQGRNQTQKTQLANEIHKYFIEQIGDSSISLTTEIFEIEKESYQKG